MTGIIFLCLGAITAADDPEPASDWYFFTEQDRATLRASAQTAWGAPLVKKLVETVEERLQHSLAVPTQEAGHFHFYFCPDHKRMLQFDWESPQRHLCPDGDHHLTGERYDLAWYVFVHGHNQRFLFNCALLHAVTGERKYIEYIRWMLLDYAAKYPQFQLHGHAMKPTTYGGKMYSQTLDESVWASSVAVAFLEALPAFTGEEARTVRTRLFAPMIERIYANRVGGNWQVWHNSGIAALAIALENPDYLEIALDDPEHGYHAMLDRGVTKDGWWNELSPGYHYYPLQAMMRTAEAVRCRGIDLYDERLKSMFIGPMQCVYSDLSFPAHNDGWHGTSLVSQAHLYELAALRFDDERLHALLPLLCAREERDEWQPLLYGKAIEPDPSPLTLDSVVLEDTGVAFLRSAARTAVLKFGAYGGGHGHPDKLSISIHDGVREIVPDLGTTGYGVPDHVQWYRKTLAHSTVVVDEKDQQPASGSLEAFEAFPDGGTVTASCTEAYGGVALRRTLTLRGRTLRDTFSCESAARHRYDYVLILDVPAPVPDSARDAELPAGGGYHRIADAREWDGTNGAAIALDGATLALSCSEPFTLVTGEAPGVPGSHRVDSSFRSCYPLILRTHGSRVTFEAEWTLRD